MPSDRLILASGSPQRRAILEQLGIAFEVVVPGVPEIESGDPRSGVVENALRKASAVEGELVLAADTAVVLDGAWLGKPSGEAEAESFLRRLSGRTHEVLSGIALKMGGELRSSCASTRVRFRALEQADLDWYLGTGEWRGRAGAYAIQGLGAALVEGVEGDFWNVVGLPVAELVRLAPGLVRGGAAAAR
ncbi:MAG: septum formation protein Maf [Thermoleophilaceae bacterium]|nr:septum formation protein Maf [Thermoleophilaceae bacterium]